MNRWYCVLGGVLMNLSLGALYGWSLFVPALEQDMNLSREQASNIFSIAIVVFALCFLIGGRVQDKKGPYVVSLTGSVLFGAGFLLTSRATDLTEMYLAFGIVRRHRRRVWLCDADRRGCQMVPGPARVGAGN